MGRHDSIDAGVRSFIEAQHVFFVASAPANGGHVNLSPKGLETLRIVDDHTLMYLDLVGSGAETIAHVNENGRIVLMLCAFEGPPKIVRLHGRGETIEPQHPDYAALRSQFELEGFARSIVRVHVERVSDSCGYGVPLYAFQGHRTQLGAWADRKGRDGLIEYQKKNNQKSIDDLPALSWTQPPPELLLFDLGGVIVEFAGPRELGKHLRWTSTPDAILDRWVQCPHTDEFERGRLTPADWADRFIKDWEVDLGREEFLAKFTTWSRRVLPGARELLDDLRRRYRIAALSNSNELHWERNTNELRILDLFDFAISSHQVGLAKPNPAIFKVALKRAGVSRPDAVIFFDDMPANVAAARAAGLRAFRVCGVEQLRERLERERLL